MRLKDIMTKEVVAVKPETSVFDAAQMMRDKNIGSIPICKDNMDVDGILTDRDIVLRVVSEGKDPKTTTCQDIMTDELVVGQTDMNINEALDLMGDEQVRRLPVVENNKLVGFVALGDMAVNSHFDDATEDALSGISTPSEPKM